MLRRLARAIVLRHPAPWRERYEAEVLALIEDSPVRPRDLGELVRGLLMERARALIEDADHPTRTARLLGSFQPLFVIVFLTTAWSLGAGLREWAGEQSTVLSEIGMVVAVACVLATLVMKFVLLRGQRWDHGRPALPSWAGLMLLPVFFGSIVLCAWGNWAGFTQGPIWVRLFIWAFIFGAEIADLSSAFWPGRGMLQAIGRLSWAEAQIKTARQWVEGCHTMIEKGIPSPLAEAQAQVDRFSRDRESALAELQQLGYRARFSPDSGIP
jgi:hypothetical protein